ncbi:MAG: hypothetical protein JWL77_5703, partial [Chthonomonadaceae bacterium]|nr:hypothetical protein [Chthonomonadaceae bacterium]
MSEYQYYEFRAIEEPLTAEQLKAVRAFSSRAEITPTSFTVTYNYGDFRGDPRKLMERYFDAHVYVSNFGSLHFMLRLPLNVIPEETLVQYAMGEVLEWWNTDEHTILDWQLNEESDGDWMEGEDWLDRMLPVRDELVRGDYRSLYLAWLSTLPGSSEEEDEDEEDYDDDLDEEDEEEDEDAEEEDDDRYSTKRREPPVPAGLQSLTKAQSALAEFLEIDVDLITAAAQESPKLTADANAADQMSEWVAQIPEQEVRAFVVRILNGESLRVQTELQ